jgi:hypothetical protein
MKKAGFITILISLLVLLSTASCNKEDSDRFGSIRVVITDDPFPVEYIEEANITITKVEIRKSDESEGYPFMTLMEDTVTYNLLDLRNGVTAGLLDMEIEAGKYDLIRLYIENASIKIKDFGSYKLKVPSGSQTGIKIFIEPGLRVEGGLSTELLLDFNLDKSFVLKGNMNTPAGIKGFNFKPVIRAVNNSTAGTVKGNVSDTSSAAIPNASVWIMSDTTIATSYTDSSGYYALPGIPEGSYSVYSTKENYDTVVFDNIEVLSANFTIIDFRLTPKIAK